MYSEMWDRPVGPVLLVVGGMSPIEGAVDGFVMDAAEELSALIVVVEHRFFGASIPQGWNASNGLELLTMQQAVADLAVFRDKFQRQVLAPQGMSQSVWLTVGCGYGGALATWARTKHPKHFAGAWASSPPLLAAVEFPSHDIHDRDTIGEECAKTISKLNTMVEIELKSVGPEVPFRLRSLFGALEDISCDDFRLMLHDSISLAVQHGFKRHLCDTLNNATGEDDLVQVFANLTGLLWGKSFGRSCYHHTSCLSSVQKELTSSRSSHWLQCTQLGLFATTPKSEEPLGLRGRSIDASFFMRRCVSAFGRGTKTDPHRPRASFKGPGRQLVVVIARDDPWRHAARVPNLEPDEVIEIDCENCGQCFDMLAPGDKDPEQLKVARDKILKHLRKWIVV